MVIPCSLLEVFRERYLNLIPFDSDGTAGDGDRRSFRPFAGLHVKFPSVPWTFDYVAFEMALSERSSRMRASIVDGVEVSGDIKQGDPDSVDFDGSSSAWRNIFYLRNSDKFRHGANPSPWSTGRWSRESPQTRQ